MDKRSLLFIACISLAFFGIQAWFGYQNHSKPPIAKVVNESPTIPPSKVTLSDLPLTPFFANEHSKQKIGYAAVSKNAILTIAWTPSLPSSVYVSELGTLSLKSKSHKIGDPVVYSKNNLKFEISSTSVKGAIDYQLLTTSSSQPKIIGMRNDGHLALAEKLQENALVFSDQGQGFLPVGVFDFAVQKVRPLSDFQDVQMIVKQMQDSESSSNGEERLFVLENEYQQLVFSTNGGSLAEINLPFKATKDSKSYVKEIEPDRLILKQDPSNARFPIHPAYFFNQRGEQPGKLGGFYPLLRRSIVKPDGTILKSTDPKYYAFSCFSETDQAPINFKVTRFEKNLIQFEGNDSQRRIIKTYTIPEKHNGPYCFVLTIEIDGDAKGLWISSGVPEVELVSGSFSPLLRYQITHGREWDIESLSPSKKHPVLLDPSIQPNWISNSNGFFGLIMDPLIPISPGYRAALIPGSDVPTRLSVIDPSYHLYPADNYPGYVTYLPLKSGSQTFRMFAGPLDDSLLKELDELYEDPIRGYNPEYSGAQSIQGWFSFISQPFSKFLDFLLKCFYWISHSWGFSIILLTIALRLMMYPLNNWSIKSSIKMQEIAPKVKAIQDRFKKDPKKGQLEVMNLYRSQGINPFSGCFPVLLQMPFLFGMFYLLKSSFPLRGASFIPGWIDNLAAPDVLFTWNYPIPLIGTEFHFLPILGGLAMYWQQKITAKLPKDTTTLSDSQKQQKMMGNIMLVVGIVMFYGLPSGLNIYFLSSTLLGLLQQWFLTKKMKEAPTLTVKK